MYIKHLDHVLLKGVILTMKNRKAISFFTSAFLCIMSATAMVADASYSDLYFELSGSTSYYSNVATKSVIHSTSDYADVMLTYGLAPTCPIGIGVANNSNHVLRANTVWFNSLEGKHIPYTSSPTPGGGEKLVLKGTAGYYYTYDGGYWEP